MYLSWAHCTVVTILVTSLPLQTNVYFPHFVSKKVVNYCWDVNGHEISLVLCTVLVTSRV